MTPDEFNKINPDVSPGTLPENSEEESFIPKPQKEVSGEKDFKQVLAEVEERKNVGEQKKETPLQESQNLKKEEIQKFDPATGQPASVAKESKVPPPLGKEIPAAPTEEPRAKPFIEKAMQNIISLEKKLAKLAKGEKIETKTVETEEVIPLTNKETVKPETKEEALLKSEKVAIKPVDKSAEKIEELPETVEEEEDAPKADKLFALPAQASEQAVAATGFAHNLPQNAAAPIQGKTESVPVPRTITEIAEQIVQRIETVKTPTEINATLTLKNLPHLDGVRVTVTSYRNAARQINIKFENLTQEAKNIMDLDVNRTALHHALDQKGYTVHIVITSTYVEGRPIEGGRSEGDRGENRGGGQKEKDEQGREEKDRERE